MSDGGLYPHSYAQSIALALAALVLWGSWASLEQLAAVRWQLFFIYFALGVAASAIALVGLLGPSPLFASDAEEGVGVVSLGLSLAAGPCAAAGYGLLMLSLATVGLTLTFPVVMGIEMLGGTSAMYLLDPAQVGEAAARRRRRRRRRRRPNDPSNDRTRERKKRKSARYHAEEVVHLGRLAPTLHVETRAVGVGRRTVCRPSAPPPAPHTHTAPPTAPLARTRTAPDRTPCGRDGPLGE
jgi:hypothetical protein